MCIKINYQPSSLSRTFIFKIKDASFKLAIQIINFGGTVCSSMRYPKQIKKITFHNFYFGILRMHEKRQRGNYCRSY